MRVTLLGPPGAGKGTLAGLLKESLGILHISTGDMLRDEMKNESDLGQEAKKFIDNGELVPDELVIKLIEKKLTSDGGSEKGYMLDGFPRNRTQAEALDEILSKIEKPLEYALYMEASTDKIIFRLTGRRVCRDCGALYHMRNKPPQEEGKCDECGGELYQRADDNEETIKTRMDVYLENTTPMIEYYQAQGKLKKLDADKDADELEKDLAEIINEDKEHDQH